MGVTRTKLERNVQGSRKHCQKSVVLSLNWMVWEIQEFRHLVMFSGECTSEKKDKCTIFVLVHE